MSCARSVLSVRASLALRCARRRAWLAARALCLALPTALPTAFLSALLPAMNPVTATLHAQDSRSAPAWQGFAPASVIATNVAVGAGLAGLGAWRAHRPVRGAVLRGAMGGAVMAGGFALGAVPVPMARVASAQTVAVGASVTRNAADGAPLLAHLTLPFAPVVVERVAQDDVPRWRVRLSGAAVVGLVQARLGPGAGALDWRATLATGAPVFRTNDARFDDDVGCPPGPRCVRAGRQRLGVVTYQAERTPAARRATLAHEALHLAQWSRDLVLFAAPAGDAVLTRSGRAGQQVARLVIADGVMPLMWANALSARAAGRYDSWYEREARTFAPGSAGSFRSSPAR